MAQCLAAPLSRMDIRRRARVIRKIAGEDNKLYFDIVKFLDVTLPKIDPEFNLVIEDKESMGDCHGLTYPDKNEIHIREDVYNRALEGSGRDRLTMAHELFHVLQHEKSNISYARAGLPISHNSSLDVRLDWRFLDLREPKNLLIFKIQTVIEHAMREFWTQNGFIEIHSPKLMGTASESGSELFCLDYFGQKAYLAQSPQFYKQMAMNAGFDRVFEIGPVFRANPSFTSRHDTEFTCVDSEISWIESHEDIMHFEERWINYFMTQLKEKLGNEILEKFGVEVTIPTVPFPRIDLFEAKEIIRKQGYSSPKMLFITLK